MSSPVEWENPVVPAIHPLSPVEGQKHRKFKQQERKIEQNPAAVECREHSTDSHLVLVLQPITQLEQHFDV